MARRERCCQLLIGLTLVSVLGLGAYPPSSLGMSPLRSSVGCGTCRLSSGSSDPDGASTCWLPPGADSAIMVGLGFPLDLNRATAEDLTRLPHIGPRLAAEIVGLRRQRSGYISTDELLEVRGIGGKTLRSLSRWLQVCP